MVVGGASTSSPQVDSTARFYWIEVVAQGHLKSSRMNRELISCVEFAQSFVATGATTVICCIIIEPVHSAG